MTSTFSHWQGFIFRTSSCFWSADSCSVSCQVAESFFATLEREVIDRRRFKSPAEARMEIFTWLEGWYNPHRRHSALGYLSPDLPPQFWTRG